MTSTDLDTMDVIQQFHGATIQHGPLNDRIYLMNTGSAIVEDLAPALAALARRQGYSKVFGKVADSKAAPFLQAGFVCEARVPGYYHGEEDAQFLGLFLTDERKTEEDSNALDDVRDIALSRANADAKPLSEGHTVRRCGPADAEAMSTIYQLVFPTYPFPIGDPDYLVKTMNENIVYYGVENDGALVALASGEMDDKAKAVEMTDFATLPTMRGQGYAIHLLRALEEAMPALGMKTGFTIARAVSHGMNITFSKAGYEYGGRLANNTNIAGQIESMNIWYKPL